MKWGMFELTINLYQVVIVVQTITNCLEKKWGGIKFKFAEMIIIVLLFLELSFVNQLVPFEGIAIIIPIMMIFLYMLISFKGIWIKKLYLASILMLGIVGITAIVFNIVGLFFNYSYIALIEIKDSIRFISLIIVQVIIFYMSQFIIKYYDVEEGKVVWDTWLMIIIMPFISIITLGLLLTLSINLKKDYQPLGEKIIIFVVIGILMINLVVYLMYIKLKKDYKNKLEYEILKQKYDIRETDIKEIKKLYQDLRKVKHDIKQHLNLLKIMLYNSKIAEAITYLENYERSEYSGNKNRIFSPNEFLNYIINSKINFMDEHGIRFYCVSNTKINGISDVELSIVLGNLLDNAMEACVESKNEKTISLFVQQVESHFIIKIENSVDTNQVNRRTIFSLKTTKLDKEKHGIGLSSVKNIVNKYGGHISFMCEENKFICTIVIDVDAK